MEKYTTFDVLYSLQISADTTPKQSFRLDGLNRFSEEEWPCFPRLLPNLTLNEIQLSKATRGGICRILVQKLVLNILS